MAKEFESRRGSEDKHEDRPTRSVPVAHVHDFTSTIENEKDPPARKLCACGHSEPIK